MLFLSAIQTTAEEIVADASPAALAALRLSFVRHLVQVNETDEHVRRTASWSDLPAAAQPLLERFVAERLLVRADDGRVEVAHEAMFRCWSRMEQWLQESAELMRWRRDVHRERDADGLRWRIREAQLAVARDWLKTRPDDLAPEEKTWIRHGLRRKRLRAGAIVAAFACVALLGLFAFSKYRTAVDRSDKAARALALNHLEFAQSHGWNDWTLAHFRQWQAYRDAPEGDPIRRTARRLLGAAYLPIPLRHPSGAMSAAYSPDGLTVLTGGEWSNVAHLWDARTGKPLHGPLPHKERLSAVAFSPDGQTVLTASHDKTARLWDAHTGKPLHEPLLHEGTVDRIVYSPDGQTVFTGGFNDAHLWDVRTGKPLPLPLAKGRRIATVAFSPDGRTAVAGMWGGEAFLLDLRTAKPLHQLIFVIDPFFHFGHHVSVAFSSDGRSVLTGEGNGARLWDVQTGKARFDPLSRGEPFTAVALSPDSQVVATATAGGGACLWDAQTGKRLHKLLKLDHEWWASHLAFSPDSQTLLTGGSHTRLWDVRTGKPLPREVQSNGQVHGVAFSPNGKTFLISAGGDAFVWDAQWGKPLHETILRAGALESAAFSPDGQSVLTASGKTARLWDIRSGKPRHEPFAHPDLVWHVAFSPDGQTIATGCNDGNACLWDARTGKPLDKLFLRNEPITALAFGRDSRTLFTGSEMTACLWNVQTGKPLSTSIPHLCRVTAAALSPDGQTLVTGSENKGAQLWDTQTGERLRKPLPHRDQVTAIAFGPDGQTILTVSNGWGAQLWNPRTGKLVHESLRHQGNVTAVAFSPDGETILSGSDDKTARLWHTRRGTQVREPLVHPHPVIAVAFSPDGANAITACSDGSVRIWPVPRPAADEPERLRLSVEVRTGYHLDDEGVRRSLTDEEWFARRKQLDDLGGFCDIRTWDQVSDAEKQALRTPLRAKQ